MANDYYQILGIDRGASAEDIKRAYRKLSKELHPDKHKGDKAAEKKYQEVNEAYETLNNPDKRKMYDQFGQTGGAGPGGFDFSGFQNADFGGFSDIFENFFSGSRGGGGRQGRNDRGADIEIRLRVTTEESFAGAKKTVRLNRETVCDLCKGNGAAPGTEIKTCTTCNGTGQTTRTAQSFFGTIQQTVVCSECRGSGKVPEKPCNRCGGDGLRMEQSDVTIDVPAGIHNGQSLRLTKEGHAGRNGASAGDLYVHIEVPADRRFARDGDDIQSILTVSVLDALLGATIKVPTLHGDVSLKIPAGSQPGQVFRIKGKGMTVLGTSRYGDQYATLQIDVPTKLSGKEKKLLEEWRELRG